MGAKSLAFLYPVVQSLSKQYEAMCCKITVFVFPFHVPSYTYLQLSAFSFVSWLLYLCIRTIYRLYFHPLAKYPGPKLAAVTLWYEFYYEYIKRGRYTWEIQKMHTQYGPIVRISPRELHIDDPDFYDVLFTQRLDKDPWACAQFGQSKSTQATASADLHRNRRAVLSPFFSQAKVNQFQSVITDKTEKLCRILRVHAKTGEPANMYDYYRGYTTDIITEYAFAKSWDFLDKPDAGKKWFFETVKGGLETAALLRHFPWITPIMDRMPPWFALFLVPDLKSQYALENALAIDIKTITDAGPEASLAEKQHPTILRELIYNDRLPASEREFYRVMAEAGLLLIAGNETTGNALNCLHFHLLANPEKMKRLKKELEVEMVEQWTVPSWQQLRKLPYLSACIDETLRISSGVPHRLARLTPKGGLAWRNEVIPEGTPVSMSNYQMHMNSTIFPDPCTFLPERWLASNSKQLKKYLAPFSKGPRVCLGIELAYAEMYLCTAMIHRRFETELYETTREDIDLEHDFFLGYPRDESKGLRIKVKTAN